MSHSPNTVSATSTETTSAGLSLTKSPFSGAVSSGFVSEPFTTPARNLAFVDAELSDIDTLISGLKNTQIILIEAGQNGIDYITQTLAGYSDLGSIHIFSHGADAMLQLGNTTLSSHTIEGYSSHLQQWQSALSREADLLFYGCDFAASEDGLALARRISQLTEADVAASNDLTGIGGDWHLEVSIGDIESDLALSQAARDRYAGTLTLLNNGDFENNLTGWNTYTNTESISTTEAFSGDRALQLSAAGSGIGQTLEAIEGETYTFTGNAKTSSSGYSAVGINFFDENYDYLDGSSKRIIGNEWQAYQLEGSAVAGSRYVQIWAYKDDGNGDVFVDNLTLEAANVVEPPTPPTAGDELLKNSGFESGLGNWNSFNGSEQASSAESFTGGNSLQLSTSDSGTSQTIAAIAGQDYKLSAYAKASGNDYAGFGLNFFDANYTALAGSLNKTVNTADWQQYTGTTTAPTGAKFVQIWTYKSGDAGDAFYDDFSLTLVDGAPPVEETTPPAASLSAGELTTSGTTAYDFDVTYTDATAVDISSIDDADIRVTGPNGFSQIASLVTVNNTTDGTPRTATYRVSKPNGVWQETDNGTYTVRLIGNQVQDTLQNAAPAANLGTFNVNIAATPVTDPGFIGLQTSTLSVDEGAGSINIVVERTGGSDGEVTVDYRTVEGSGSSATAGVDYTSRTGSLTFADGQTQRSVTIAITNDTLAEESESFGFAIDNVQGGATLLAPRTAQITIEDNDALTYRGNQYVLTRGAKTWEQAQAEAESLGGNLVSINAAAEETWLKQTFGSTEGFWIGLNDTAVEGQFEWASGEALTYTNWAPGEPNNGQGNQDYGWMNYGPSQQWDDNFGSATLRGIVEIGSFNGPANPVESGGNGLLGEYYNNEDFTNLALSRNDATLDFNWGNGSPDATIGADTYSARWSGEVEARYTENYTLQTRTDDGVRLWINNELIIDQFVLQAPTTHTGTISLVAGQKYDIRMDYFERTGGAVAQLSWSSASQALEIVPESQLYSDPVATAPTAQTIITGLDNPTAIDWRPNSSQMFIAQKGGVVEVYENGNLLSTPFIDISDQVNGTRDRGLLDIALHPDFTNNPYVYLLFTYDPPEVFNFTGDSGPDGNNNRAGRLIRVTADAANGYRTAVAGSEVVLLGKNSTWDNFNGRVNSTFNFTEPEAGKLPDGSYLQDFLNADSESHTIGSVEFGTDGSLYVSNGDGASYNRVDPRAARVQDIDSLSGKILRIDPITGEGLSDNPFYNGDADADRSKVYQLGLRNPFRMTVDPNSGQLYIGDVGWTLWEEINAAGAGANFGWPYYEGGNGVSTRTGRYENLPEAQDFYASGTPVTASLLGLNHITDGINAIVVGDVYTGNVYDAQYQGDLFFNDLGQGIVRNISFDEAGNIESIDTFDTNSAFVVQMVEGPDDLLYYVNLVQGTVGRWTVEA
ncbi:MAG: DUF4347 domain-containing protein [Cyanobacteria bacterium J06634_5]